MPELKPCPWSHTNGTHAPEIMFFGYTKSFHVGCECGASGPFFHDGNQAVDAWNSWADELERVKRENERFRSLISRNLLNYVWIEYRHPTSPGSKQESLRLLKEVHEVLGLEFEAPE